MADRVPTSRLARGSKLGAAIAGQAMRSQASRLAMLGRSEAAKARLSEESTIRAAEQMVSVLGSMKGVAMKLGQMLSVLDLNMVPPEHRDQFQTKLAALRNAAPEHSFPTMRRVIESEIGCPINQLFSHFKTEPIGAASIGQVYRARLHDGRDVAVKVQYPGIDAAVRADLKNLSMMRALITKMLPWVTGELLDELRANMEVELDYVSEAKTQNHVAEMFADHPFIRVPRAVVEFSTPRVLITEFLDGLSFDEIRELDDAERDRVGEIVYRFYMGSLFRFNEFCGDPHPGNILLCRDGKVGFVDFGLFARMNPDDVEFERQCLIAAAEDRGEDLYKLMDDRGIFDSDVPVTVDECLEYVNAASQWCLFDDDLTITPELASGAMVLAVDPRATEFSGMKHQALPPEHLFSRRADFLCFGVLGQLEATANWHRIAREWLYREEPYTDLGLQELSWMQSR